jgi:hypothetical protein
VKSDPPSAEQKRWRETVRSQGCIFGYEDSEVQIHHVVGRTAVYCKIPIGHWFIIPCTEAGHRELEKLSHQEQKRYFLTVCRHQLARFQPLPFSADVMWAIMDWRR